MVDAVDAAWVRDTAAADGFDRVAFERAYRLARLVEELASHPWLSTRVALKGGTAINFFHADLARLSIDLDLNYIGSVDLEVMRAERPRVIDEITRIVEAQGYRTDPRPDSHALWASRFVYRNTYGGGDSIKADVNFLHRVPLYGIEHRTVPDVFELGAARVPCLSVEELYGGKLSALATRGAPRDVYDAVHLVRGHVKHDPERLRKAFLFHACMSDATLQTVDLARIEAMPDQTYFDELYPMLRSHERPTPASLKDEVLPHVERLLDLSPDERRFCDRLESHAFEPRLLFGDPPVAENIDRHPAGLWRARRPHAKRDHDAAAAE